VKPDGGRQIEVAPAQLSVAAGATKSITAVVLPGSVPFERLEGQLRMGGRSSTTVTVNEQVGPTPVVQVTVVLPAAKTVPDGGAQLTAPHEPITVGAG
jgi:hypothetical protein